ncbi:MAG: site-specific DNA-methyltransferase, partial [Planctomycetota bacterium]
MSQKYEKLKTLLKELFQLDQPDLDFGLYRIMHSKSAEVTQFLDKDLLPQVKELRARLKTDVIDVAALESEVYDHLFSFFRRYYSEGDFLAKRVYKAGTYAIPYEGEEVKLYWANQDQYYIKSSKYLSDYAFRLRPDDEQKPMRVHFRLADAAEGEHGNVKPAEGKERRFRLAADRAVSVEGGELVIRFTYQPSQEKQKSLNVAAEAAILASKDPLLAPWTAELAKLSPTEKEPQRTVLGRHLEKYSDVDKFDYFIHKDLGGFLRRELDFYIKNEVMHLDDVENETAPRVEQYLSKIKVIRKIAGKIIDFLAQLEDFQKKLWLKKKFVVETSWCIALGVVPEEFYAEIVANDSQREEWVKLCAIDEIRTDTTMAGYSKPLKAAFLKGQPTLMVDTRHFDDAFTARILDACGDVGSLTDGVLIHGENAAALALMGPLYKQSVKCVYIDPPYNTGGDGFAYKDAYQDSSWLSMMRDRLAMARDLLSGDGVLLSSIDDIEQPKLRMLMDVEFGGSNRLANMVWKGATDNNPTRIATEHEYIVCYAKSVGDTEPEWKSAVNDAKELMLKEWERLRHACKVDQEIQQRFREFIRNNRETLSPITHYDRVDEEGPYTGGRKVHNPGKEGYRYDVIHPRTGRPCVQPARGYRFPSETLKALLASGKILFGEDESQIIQIKEYLRDYSAGLKGLVELDSRVAANVLEGLFGSRVIFKNPKPVELLLGVLSFVLPPRRTALDFFAGSGTTGQAVLGLNREDGGRRRFLLVEIGDHFDAVLVPRIKKVAFTPEWRSGKPARPASRHEADRGPRIVKVVRLESYEDALNNLEMRRTGMQQRTLGEPNSQGSDSLKEQYVLHYMLDVETRGSQSLLKVQAFADPSAYKLKVKRPGSDESRETNVDLLETFNWLIGLTVRHMAAPMTFSAAFERDGEGRLKLKGRLKEDPAGPYWFRAITGTMPDGRRTLIVWRKLTGEPEQDNLVL